MYVSNVTCAKITDRLRRDLFICSLCWLSCGYIHVVPLNRSIRKVLDIWKHTVSRRRAERKDRPACRVPFLSDRPSNPHKEMQKKVLCGLFFPFVFLRGAVRKVSRLLSWAWVEGNLRRMGYRTGLCCFSPVLPYIYLWWPEKCMTTPHFEEGSGN